MKVYRYIQVLSLDVVAGACISALYIADLLEIALPTLVLAALGISVWLIYTIDHLLDAYKIDNPTTFRHQFHKKNAKFLLVCCALVALGGAWITLYLPYNVISSGVIILVIVFIYFLSLYMLRNKIVLHKELTVAAVYATGILVPSMTILPDYNLNTLAILFSIFFLLALGNVLIFSIYDEEADRNDGHVSITLAFGSNKVDNITYAILVTGIIGSFMVLREQFLVFPAMFLVLVSILFFRNYFVRNELYRAFGDGIFLLPAITLLL